MGTAWKNPIYLDQASKQTVQDFKIPKMPFLAKFDQLWSNLTESGQNVDFWSKCPIEVNFKPS